MHKLAVPYDFTGTASYAAAAVCVHFGLNNDDLIPALGGRGAPRGMICNKRGCHERTGPATESGRRVWLFYSCARIKRYKIQ